MELNAHEWLKGAMKKAAMEMDFHILSWRRNRIDDLMDAARHDVARNAAKRAVKKALEENK